MLKQMFVAMLVGAAAAPFGITTATASTAPAPPLHTPVRPAVLQHAAAPPPHRAAVVRDNGVRLHAEAPDGTGSQIGSLSQKDVITAVRCQDFVPYPGNNWYHVDVAGKPSGVVSAEFVTLLDAAPQCYQPAPTPVQ